MTQQPLQKPAADQIEYGLGMKLRKAMPAPLKYAYRGAKGLATTLRALSYDAVRFARFSGTFTKDSDPAVRRAEITKYYHMIEKGLALPQPRPGFGKIAIRDLCLKVQKAIADDIRTPEITNAADALAGYAAFNQDMDTAYGSWVDETVELARQHGLLTGTGPTKPGNAPADTGGNAMLDFLHTRHSVRNFAESEVPDDVLQQAVRAAQAAPCVCNRQASRVYFLKDKDLRTRALACQNGNRGFGDTAPVVAIVTVDQRHFLDASERYQPWIDGGLFTMNLLLGFHAQGYGSCCLNWSALPAQDKRLRQLGIVQPYETVITMIAIGAPKEGLTVARSPRKPIEDVMEIR